MSEFTSLREAVDALAERALPSDFGELQRRAIRRSRRRVVMVAAATAAIVAGSVLAVTGLDHDRRLVPVEHPKLVVGAVPVWYDAQGLHRGEVVEQTPVNILQPERPVGRDQVASQQGALALVRSGALYRDPASNDVWFHPWGGKPRIVGHNSEAGPGGDPNGDTAAWFEGSDTNDAGPGELVIYDTATGREISRTRQSHGVSQSSGDHYPAGNGFLQVSAERVIWSAWATTYSHDIRTRTTTVVTAPVADLHDDIEVLRGDPGIVLRVPGRADEQYPDLETHLRLSPSGEGRLPARRHRRAPTFWRSRARRSGTPRPSSTPGPVTYGGCRRTRIPGSPGRTGTSPWWRPNMSCSPVTPPVALANPCRPSVRS